MAREDCSSENKKGVERGLVTGERASAGEVGVECARGVVGVRRVARGVLFSERCATPGDPTSLVVGAVAVFDGAVPVTCLVT